MDLGNSSTSDGRRMLDVELDPRDAATGGETTIALAPGRSAVVRIPPGVTHDTVLQFPGADTSSSGSPGDLLVRVVIRSGAVSPFQPDPVPSRRRSGRWVTFAAIITVVVAVSVGASLFIGGYGRTPASQAEASPVSSLRPVTPAEYQQLLTALDTELGAGFLQVGAGRNPAALTSAIQALLDASQRHLTTLSGLAPPQPATAAHKAISSALTELRAVLSATLSAVRSADVCTGTSALSKVTSSPAAAAVRAAAQGLTVADPAHPYLVGAFLPGATSDQNRTLANGTLLKMGTRNGAGKLTIENSTTRDAVVNVVPAGSKTTAITVYVAASNTFAVTGVKDGSYEIFINQGVDWDSAAAGFSRDCAYQKFEDRFEFTTTSSTTTQWTIGLKRVPDGNAPVGDVDPGDFPT